MLFGKDRKEKEHPKFGKLISRPDIRSFKGLPRLIAFFLSILILAPLFTLPRDFHNYHSSQSFYQMLFVLYVIVILATLMICIALHLVSILMMVELYEFGFIIRFYQSWWFRKGKVISYDFTEEEVIGIDELGNRTVIIRRGKYPINNNIFDDVLIDFGIKEKRRITAILEEEHDVRADFNNYHKLEVILIPIFIMSALLIFLLFLHPLIDWIGAIGAILILIYIIYCVSFIYGDDPWDDEKFFLICGSEAFLIPHSSKSKFFDVNLNEVTKLEYEIRFFKRIIRMYHTIGDRPGMTRFPISVIWNNREKFNKLYHEVRKRIPSEAEIIET